MDKGLSETQQVFGFLNECTLLVRLWLSNSLASSIKTRCQSQESPSGHDYQYGPTFMLSGGGAAMLTGICRFCGKKIEHKIEGLLMPLEMMTQRKGDLQ
jgi:hypothetical protein